MAINNEADGISAEVAIAKTYDIAINEAYLSRADDSIVKHLMQNFSIKTIFDKEHIPTPIKHVAEGQNPVDFELQNSKTLSVKTNQDALGKAAPQKIGQPTSMTFFSLLKDLAILPDYNVDLELRKKGLDDNYANRSILFKELVFKNIDVLMSAYWKNMFECDYVIVFFNLEKQLDPLKNYRVFGFDVEGPKWDKDKFSFTRNLSTWNESNTVKYAGITIGEFQVHRNRNCFKFRFNMKSVVKLINGSYI